jgi:hypothetical protein
VLGVSSLVSPWPLGHVQRAATRCSSLKGRVSRDGEWTRLAPRRLLTDLCMPLAQRMIFRGSYQVCTMLCAGWARSTP